jgi:phosphate ABC transporter permease protein PstC
VKSDKIISGILLAMALTAITGLAVITVFIFREGVPIIFKVGVGQFFFSSDWEPSHGHFGILSMIAGSFAVTAGAAVIGVVFGLGLAIVLTQFAPRGVAAALKPAVELLAGIPSVVYGFVGVVTLVPLIRQTLGGPGLSVLAASIVLGIMVLPTITSIAIDALQAVPRSYLEGSIALGATRWQTVTMVLLKAARSGLVAAVILGMGRAIGETMAVIMVAGNALEIPGSLLDPVRTLTSNIALEMGYATGNHRQALFATGVTLFVIITLLNIAALSVSRRGAKRRSSR